MLKRLPISETKLRMGLEGLCYFALFGSCILHYIKHMMVGELVVQTVHHNIISFKISVYCTVSASKWPFRTTTVTHQTGRENLSVSNHNSISANRNSSRSVDRSSLQHNRRRRILRCYNAIAKRSDMSRLEYTIARRYCQKQNALSITVWFLIYYSKLHRAYSARHRNLQSSPLGTYGHCDSQARRALLVSLIMSTSK